MSLYDSSNKAANTPVITAAGLEEANRSGNMTVPFDGLVINPDSVELLLGGECMLTVAVPQLATGRAVFRLSGLKGIIRSRNTMATVAPVAGPSNAMAAMAREYMDWIDFFHAGNGSYDDFLKLKIGTPK